MSGPRFSIIPRDAILDDRLEGQDLRVLALLGSHTDNAGWCCLSQVKMARELKCARSTVQRALGRLIECGYLEQRALVRRDGGDRAHEYRVLLDDVRPAQFINEADELASSETGETGGDEDADIGGAPLPVDGHPPAHGRAGVPMDGQGVPGHGSAPIRTTLLKRSERETRAPVARKASEEEIVAAAYADDAFMAVIGPWPTASSDGPLSTYPVWCALSDDERAEAARFAPTAIAQHVANGRKGAYGLRAYLVEKRWKLLPAAISAGVGRERAAAEAPPASVPARSKPWFAVFWRRWKAGEKAKLMFDQGMRGLPYGVRPADMPGEAELAGLVSIQTAEDGRATAEMAAWRDALAADGISFTPIDLRMPFVFVPSRWPPGHARAGDGAAAEMLSEGATW